MQFLKKLNHRAKRLVAMLAVLVLTVTVIGGCDQTTKTPSSNAETQVVPQIQITKADTTVNGEDPIAIDLGGAGSVCSITEPGCYVLSGSYQGRIEVDAQDQVVHLIFAGVDIKTTSGPAVQVLSGGKVIITLQEGTVNTLLDAATYPQDSEANACIYSECDLTINGTGALNLSGYYEDGIRTKDVLKILGGNVFVQAKRDALRGNDGIVVTCQSLEVQSERNGLYTTKIGKVAKGNIEIYGGDYSVIAGGYAVSCANDLYIDQCQMYAIGVLGIYEVGGRSFIAEVSGE